VSQHWWLHNTTAGRRTLSRLVPPSALSMETRRLMCDEQGHDFAGDGSCLRCAERPTPQQASALRTMPNLQVVDRYPSGVLVVVGAERRRYALDRQGYLRPERSRP
jgi:hypothetical protein